MGACNCRGVKSAGWIGTKLRRRGATLAGTPPLGRWRRTRRARRGRGRGLSSPAERWTVTAAWVAMPGMYCRQPAGRNWPPMTMSARVVAAPAVCRMTPPRPTPMTAVRFTARARRPWPAPRRDGPWPPERAGRRKSAGRAQSPPRCRAGSPGMRTRPPRRPWPPARGGGRAVANSDGFEYGKIGEMAGRLWNASAGAW
jgi:hypothetical protein